MQKNTVYPIVLRSQAAALFTGIFSVINAGGLGQPCFFLRINNASNVRVFLSFDGVTEHEFLAANQVLELPNQANSSPQNYSALWPASTLIYVKSPDGAGAGAVYISGYYSPNS